MTDIDNIIIEVHKLLLEHLPPKSHKTPSGWQVFNCPMCSDRRKRAGVITDGAKVSYHCFNCNYTTGWSPSPFVGKKYKDLATALGASSLQIHQAQVELLKHSDELETAELDSDYAFNFTKFNVVALPENTVMLDSLPEEHELVQYAKSRGIWGLYPLLHFPDIVYKRRLVVPFTYNGDVVGWTGRHVSPPDKNTPKYYQNMPSGYVFNIDRFSGSQREIVIVTEGIFDAILVDGVSVIGNTVTSDQAHLIQQLGKRVIVCPDRDEAGKQLIEQAVALGWEVSFPPWAATIKDASDACATYGRLATVASIIKHATNNKLKIQVKTKIL